jgi:hypothetical protein
MTITVSSGVTSGVLTISAGGRRPAGRRGPLHCRSQWRRGVDLIGWLGRLEERARLLTAAAAA